LDDLLLSASPDRIGGQGVSPQEQKTQQSPGLGFSTDPHPGQSKKYWQASSGMTCWLV